MIKLPCAMARRLVDAPSAISLKTLAIFSFAAILRVLFGAVFVINSMLGGTMSLMRI